MPSFSDFMRARELYQGEVIEWNPNLKTEGDVIEARFAISLPHPSEPEIAYRMRFEECTKGGVTLTEVDMAPEWRRTAQLNEDRDIDKILKNRLENYRSLDRMNWGIRVNRPLLDHALLALSAYCDQRKPGGLKFLAEDRIAISLFRVLRSKFSQSADDYGIKGDMLVRKSEANNNQLCESVGRAAWVASRKAQIKDVIFLEHDHVRFI